MTSYSTKGVSPKMRGAIVAVIAASSSLATSYVETGGASRVALGALVGALFSAVGVWFGGVGNVRPVEGSDQKQSEMPVDATTAERIAVEAKFLDISDPSDA